MPTKCTGQIMFLGLERDRFEKSYYGLFGHSFFEKSTLTKPNPKLKIELEMKL